MEKMTFSILPDVDFQVPDPWEQVGHFVQFVVVVAGLRPDHVVEILRQGLAMLMSEG